MENVPKLAKFDVFGDFVKKLEDLSYFVSYKLVECEKYGLPQTRKRLVLLASKFGGINLIEPTHTEPESFVTVRDVLEGYPELRSGEAIKGDPLHKSAELSALNLKRIKASKPGGSWRDWPKSLITECHKKESGNTYVSVYGRMEWDKPSPTVTTQYYGYGNGRFGHPYQHRAISLREGATLQSFPSDYKFTPDGQSISTGAVGRLVGNAVPPLLGKIVGQSIQKHVSQYN